MNTIPPDPEPVPSPPPSAHQRVLAAFERIAELDRPEIWTTLRAQEDVLVDAKAVDERIRAGEELPLAGSLLAVKEGIDVAGLPTVAARPSSSSLPEVSATAVSRLTAAGAVVLGKTDPRQLAADPLDVASGVAVAVSLGIVDLSLGTDLTGAGRVPAALNGVVGLKPTPGLVPVTGISLERSCDGVAVFARGLVEAQRAVGLMTGPDCRAWPADVRFGAGEHPRLAVPDDDWLRSLAAPARLALGTAAAALRASGVVVEPCSLKAFREAGEKRVWEGHDALLLPTLPEHPDVAAVRVPSRPGEQGPSGVTVVTRAFDDQLALDLAAVLTGEPPSLCSAPAADLVVFGAHLRGQPLNTRLVALGARFMSPVRTAERYRMVLLPTEPPQPGVVPAGDNGLDGERWRLSPAALGRFAADLPEPFVLGRIELEDGTCPQAVLCEASAADGAEDLARYESWRGYLRFVSTAGPRDPG
ncbi:amidase family protein [Amycolatopsis sp. NPDC059021]|uniref:allophanate hydrolase-related protein n=1 Tax=Amycolatopsis sp. NPDC059021 TaxID=3346704 RepID=UPI00366FD7E9